MEADEEQGSATSEPQEQSEGSSSDQSNAEDDEWRPCRRKVVRRVNLQRSQATKLMWQRKRAAAAAALLLQQQQQQHEGNNPGLMGPSSSTGLIGTSTTLDQQTAGISQSMRALSVSAVSKCKPAAAQQQQQPPPSRRRRFPAKSAGTARRFSMCWSDTTLGSSLAGKPSLKPKEESHKNQKSASLIGLKAYRHINAPSAAGSAQTVEELHTDEITFSGANARPYLERACRPKLFQRDESSGSEDSEEDECDSAADQAEKISDSDTDESMEEFPPERPTLRPKLLQTPRSHSFSRSHLDEARKQEFHPVQYSTNKTEAVTFVMSETTRPGPRLICRGNYVTESDLLAQELSLSNSVPSLGSTFVAPAFALPAKLRWKLNPAEYQEYTMPAKMRHKQDRLLSSVAKGKDIGTADKNEPGTSSGCSVVAPLVAAVKTEPKEQPSERRSRAKRLWWEQIKQLDLRLSSGGAGCAISEESVEDLLNSLPKFLLAELFPDQTSTRKRTKKASHQPNVPAKTSVVPSRRSLIMKENWRKRKEAWLSAAAQTLAAASRPVCASGSNPPSPSTEQCEDSGPTEDSSQYLARSMALLRCRQYRHDIIAQMDLQQRYCNL